MEFRAEPRWASIETRIFEFFFICGYFTDWVRLWTTVCFYLFLLSRRSSSTGAVSDHAIIVFKMFAVHEVDWIRRRPNSWLALGINPLPNRSFRFRVIFSDVNHFYEESHRSIFIVTVESTRLKQFLKKYFVWIPKAEASLSEINQHKGGFWSLKSIFASLFIPKIHKFLSNYANLRFS